MVIFFVFYIIFAISIFSIISCVLIKNQKLLLYPKLDLLFKKEHFSNISKETSNSNIIFVNASNRGENYLFAFKNNNYIYSLLDINTIYEKAQKNHIHNVIVLITTPLSKNILNKLKEYNIQVWDYNKLDSLAYSQESTSILQTSNTSDDTCKIEHNQVDPIQEPKSLFKNLFRKPDRL